MDVVDERGRLFGLVNVVDALVVLLVAVVIVAGVGFVHQRQAEPAQETATTSAVLDLGTQPGYVVDRLRVGDTYSPGGLNNLTVTGIYVAPEQEAVRVLLAIELEGPVSAGRFSYGGEPLRFGRQLTILTADYQVTGRLSRIAAGLDGQTTRVLVSQTVDPSVARSIQTGDTYVIAGHEVASVETVEVFATDAPERRRVFLGLAIRTVNLGGGPQFGPTALRLDDSILFRTDDYAFSGRIERVGAAELRGEPSSRAVTLEVQSVDIEDEEKSVEEANSLPLEIADSLRSGMTETVAGQTNAKVTNVRTRPATVLLVGRDGHVIYGEHPTRKRVTLTAELSTRETATGPTFKGRRLQLGRTVHLDLGTVTVEATVVEIGERPA